EAHRGRQCRKDHVGRRVAGPSPLPARRTARTVAHERGSHRADQRRSALSDGTGRRSGRRSRRHPPDHAPRADTAARLTRRGVLRADRGQRRVPRRRRQAAGRGGGSPAMSPVLPAVTHAEWTKLRSVRSTVWSLVATIGITVALGILFCFAYTRRFDRLGLRDRLTFDPTAPSPRGLVLAQPAIRRPAWVAA